ncbi:MAG: T9SS type A sorting domain-containing protein [bacterium]|nr:T9SS type A sorting domain-containing protein [bacterium]
MKIKILIGYNNYYLMRIRKIMKVFCLIFVGINLFFLYPLVSEATITFERNYGDSDAYGNQEYGNLVQQTSDEGYIIVGNIYYSDSSSYKRNNVLLIKTDSLGDTLWTRSFGWTGQDEGNSVQQTKDGGYIIVGRTTSFKASLGDVWLIKTDSLGDTLWTKVYGGGYAHTGNSVQQTKDGGYIIIGYTSSLYTQDIWLIKTDSVGDTLWTKVFDRNTTTDYAKSVQQTTDNGYVLVGNSEEDVWLVKTDSLGDSLWTKVYGDSCKEYGNSVQQTFDNGYIIAGTKYPYGAGNNNSKAWLIKTDSAGDTLWTKILGGDSIDNGNSVQETFDKGYIITGGTYSYGAGHMDVWLIKTDINGDTLWTKTFGGLYLDYGKSVQQTKDGGYIITGVTDVYPGITNSNVFLIKTDSLGKIGIEEENQISKIKYQISTYPNPFRQSTLISYKLPIKEKVSIKLYDISGRNIRTLIDEEKTPGSYKIKLSTQKLEMGIYFIKFLSGNYKETKKLTLIK